MRVCPRKLKRRNLLLLLLLPLWVTVRFYGGVLQAVSFPELADSTPERSSIASSSTSTPKRKPPSDLHNGSPLFILHVGPPKTGTTTVQWYAANHEDLLNKHNIYYLGHYGKRKDTKLHPLSYACKQRKDKECKEQWEELERVVNDHYEKGHNLFLSEEIFSNYHDERHEKKYLWKYLVPMLSKWRVRLVLSYRRFYEWAPSWYAQINQPTKIDQLKIWPSEGGTHIPTFPDYFEQETEKSFKQLFSLKRKWKQRFPDVWMSNMHTGGQYQNEFFCKMIPEATQLCDYLKSEDSKNTTSKNLSSSKGLHFDMLAYEAHKRGWVPNGVSRVDARRAVEKHSRKNLGITAATDFPMKCMSSKQSDRLLQWSLELETEMVPNFHKSPRGEAELRAEFAAASDKQKFCSIDVHATLEDKQWQPVFQKLAPR